MTRFWDGRTDGQTDGRSDCTPRPAFAFGDAGKKNKYGKTGFKLRYYVLAIFTELYSHFGVHIKQLVVFTKFHI